MKKIMIQKPIKNKKIKMFIIKKFLKTVFSSSLYDDEEDFPIEISIEN